MEIASMHSAVHPRSRADDQSETSRIVQLLRAFHAFGVPAHRAACRPIVGPLVRQAQLGAFLQGESPCGVRINHPLLPSVATATEEVETPNESVEAYTGKHADRRRDRDLQSLIQPRHGV